MNIDEKIQLAKSYYNSLNFKDYTLVIKRDDEIKADFIWISNSRGPGGLIIGDDGSYLYCQSSRGYDYWKEEYKKGLRSKKISQ